MATARRVTLRLEQWPAGGVGGSPASLPLSEAPPHLTCNNLPDLVGGCHACGGVRAATAAPWPASAAQPTGHAWPAAGGLLTWGVGWPQAGLGGRGCLPNTEQSPEQQVQGNGQDKAKACKEPRRPLGEGCPSTAPPPPAERPTFLSLRFKCGAFVTPSFLLSHLGSYYPHGGDMC